MAWLFYLAATWQRSNCFPVFSERQDFSVADTPSCVYLKREILRSRSSSSLRCNIRLFKSATIGSSGAQCRSASAISSSSDCCRRSRFTTSSVFRKSSHSRRKYSKTQATTLDTFVYRERPGILKQLRAQTNSLISIRQHHCPIPQVENTQSAPVMVLL